MEKQPLLSVVVPIYNGQRHISDLLSMFAAQKPGFELIAINDGSTDATAGLLAAAQSKHAFLRVFSQANAGVSAARNAGVEKAQGDYISFVDADDKISPQYVEALLALAPSAPDLVFFPLAPVALGQGIPAAPAAKALPKAFAPARFLRRFLHNPTQMGSCNFMLRKEWLLEKGLSFRLGFPYYEDYDFVVRAAALAKEVLVTEEVLYYYVQQSDSAMRSFGPERLRCLSLIEDLCVFLHTAQPAAAPEFERFLESRLYWSVLWQASLAFKKQKDVITFAKNTHAKERLKKLGSYPDKRVRLTARLFCLWPGLFIALVRFAGRKTRKNYTLTEDYGQLLQKPRD